MTFDPFLLNNILKLLYILSFIVYILTNLIHFTIKNAAYTIYEYGFIK